MCELTSGGGICPYKFDCKVYTPGEMPGCVLKDIDWNIACDIYHDYTRAKAEAYAETQEGEWYDYLNVVEYINPE